MLADAGFVTAIGSMGRDTPEVGSVTIRDRQPSSGNSNRDS
jgi:hypothetical protein